MTDKEACLLEIINTGPCEIKELTKVAPSLMTEALQEKTFASEVQPSIDKLNSMGMIGLTGAKLEIVVGR